MTRDAKGKHIPKTGKYRGRSKVRLQERKNTAESLRAESSKLSPLDKLRKVKAFLNRPLAVSKGWQSAREIARLEKQVEAERKRKGNERIEPAPST